MPEWCSTTYRFHGNEKQIGKLNEILQDAQARHQTVNSFGDAWLGNVLHAAGLQSHIDKDVRCRGSIQYVSEISDDKYGNKELTVDATSDWDPAPGMWDLIIKELRLDTIRYDYIASEPSSDLYLKYDPHGFNDFPEEVVIEYENVPDKDGIKHDDTLYCSRHEAVEFLQDALQSKETDLDVLAGMEPPAGIFISVGVYETVTG